MTGSLATIHIATAGIIYPLVCTTTGTHLPDRPGTAKIRVAAGRPNALMKTRPIGLPRIIVTSNAQGCQSRREKRRTATVIGTRHHLRGPLVQDFQSMVITGRPRPARLKLELSTIIDTSTSPARMTPSFHPPEMTGFLCPRYGMTADITAGSLRRRGIITADMKTIETTTG